MTSNRIESIRNPVIYVIDDDSFFLRFAMTVLQEAGYEVLGFLTGESFLESAIEADVGCVVTDLHLPGIQGTEIQEELRRKGSGLSLIVVSGDIDIRTAVQIVKHGAVTLLPKPLVLPEFLDAVAEGIALSERLQVERCQWNDFRNRYSQLLENETKVLELLAKGQSHKAISRELDLSPRSVDRMRKNLLDKMQVATLPELISMIAKSKVIQ